MLSHWHSDHSGGLLSFLHHRRAHVGPTSTGAVSPVQIVADLHPDRPIARGIAPPRVGQVIGRLPADPEFAQIAALGAIVETHAEGHAIAGGTVWVSGEIPRVTHFEGGLPGAVRWVEPEGGEKGEWVKEEVKSLILL